MTDADEKIVRIRVSGRVQGVGYRAFTQRAAEALGVRGWVRNRRNGDVEAVFAGRPEAVAALCAACRQGPDNARVDELNVAVADHSALAEAGDERGFVQLANF